MEKDYVVLGDSCSFLANVTKVGFPILVTGKTT